MNNLGERIKKIRKLKRKTLSEIAGDGLSVSMLSLIENNKSAPSMEKLNYIADRLEVSVTELISEESTDFTEQLWEKVDGIVKRDGLNNSGLYALIENNLDKITNSIFGAKIYKVFAYLQVIKQNQELSLLYIKKAEDIYKSYGMWNQVLETWIDIAMFQFASGNYKVSLKMLIENREKMDYEKFLIINKSANIRISYLIGSLYAAIDNSELAKQYLDESIQISLSTGDFSEVSETFRLRNIIAIFENEQDIYETYTKKLELLMKLTSNNDFKFSLYFSKMSYEYLVNNEPLRILGLFESYKYNAGYEDKVIEDIHNTYIHLIVGIAYFKLEEYERAMSYFQLINTSLPLANHPIDICMRSEREAYMALIYQLEGDIEKAYDYSNIAMEKIKNHPDNHYKKFIMKTYHEIRKVK